MEVRGAQDVTVIAGGWSVRNVAIDRLCGLVIAVNDAAYHLPKYPDIVVSMDRLWSEYRWDWMQNRAGETWLRRSAVQNLDTRAAIEARWLHVYDCDNNSDQFTRRRGWLNGMNSGACALNLAWRLKPRRLFLLGFDMNRDTQGRASWHPPYPWTPPTGATTNGTYAKWAKSFNRVALEFAGIGCEVWNVSSTSAIKAFPKMTPADYAKECSP